MIKIEKYINRIKISFFMSAENEVISSLLKVLKNTELGLEKLMQFFYPKISSVLPKEIEFEEFIETLRKHKVVIVGEKHSKEYQDNEKKIISYLNNGQKIYVGDEILEDAIKLADSLENKETFQIWDLKNKEDKNKQVAENIEKFLLKGASVFVVVGEAHILEEKSIQYYLLQKEIIPLVIYQDMEEKNRVKIIKYSDYFYFLKGKL